MEDEFSKRCIDNGVPEKTAKEVYAMIKKFAEYGFNKSHSAAYGLIAYETAYLKAHYPECFMAANCTINADNKDKLIPCLAEIKTMGIELLQPTLQNSLSTFSIERKDGQLAIRYGINGIEGIGEDIANQVTSLKNAMSLLEFIEGIPHIRTNQISNMIHGGVFDSWGCRKEMVKIVPSIIETVKYHQKINKIYGHSILDDLCGEENYEGIEYGFQEKMSLERKNIHICLNGHPLEQIRPILKVYNQTINDIKQLNDETDVQILCQLTNVNTITTKKGQEMAFVELGDEYDSCEGIIFPKTYEGIQHLVEDEAIVIVTGKVQVKEMNGEMTTSIIINTMKKAIDRPLRIYILKRDLEVVEKEIMCKNGLAEIICVDNEQYTVTKKDYFVDYMNTTQILVHKEIPFIA